MFVVRCLLPVVGCSVFVVCRGVGRSGFSVCCALVDVCCLLLLCVVRCLVFVVCCVGV